MTNEQWLEKMRMEKKGSVLFPKWRTFRAGLAKYNVQYEYTLVDMKGDILKRGYIWTVDISRKTISERRDMKEKKFKKEKTY